MGLKVKIKGNDNYAIAKDLFCLDSHFLEKGKTEKAIAEGVTLRYDGISGRICASADSQVTFILEMAIFFGRNIALPVVAAILSRYIYDKIKDRKAESITIGQH